MRHAPVRPSLLLLSFSALGVAVAPGLNSAAFAQAITVSSPLSASGSALEGAAATLAFDARAMDTLKPARRVMMENFTLGPNLAVTLDLKSIEPFAADAKIVAASMRGGRLVEEPIERPDAVFLGGCIAGIDDSQAFLALSRDAQQGWVRLGGRMFIISSGPYGARMPAMVYDLAALPAGAITFNDAACATEQLAPIGESRAAASGDDGSIAGSGDTAPCREVRIALDTDYEFTANKFGGNPIAAATYAATIMAGCNQIYTNDLNVRTQISFLRLWLTPSDPWTQTGSSAQLTEFRNYWEANQQSTSRTLAHMLSARGLGGGVAWLSVMCNSTFGYAVSGNINGFFPYPLQNNNSQNWDMMVFAHETGHNFSSPHTHSYTPPIDGCGLNPADCTLAAQGTIMSYCHTCSGGMTNIALDLHPIVEAYILNSLSGLSCKFLGSALVPQAQDDRGFLAEGASLTIDVLKNDLETNCDSATIDSFAPTSINGGSVVLSVGTGPNGRDQLAYTAPTGYNGIDTFTYVIRDGANQTGSATVSVRVYGFRTPDAPVRFQSGAKARYYSLTSPSVLPDFATLVPFTNNTATSVNFPSTGGNFAGSGIPDNVGAVYTGWITAPTTGLYTMYLESDDGSRLWVGNEVIVGNDGLHGMVERSGLVGLQAGRHKVRIEFFEAGGGAGLIARYSGPGVSKQVIPAANWSRALPADINESGSIDVNDLLAVIAGWGPCTAGCEADVNGDQVIDVNDLLGVVSNWG